MLNNIKTRLKCKRRRKSIPLSKYNKRLLLVFGVISILFIVLFVFALIFPIFAEFFWFKIRNPFYDLMFSIFQKFPQFGMNIHFIFLGIITLLTFVNLYFEYNKKFSFNKKTVYVNRVSCFSYCFIFFMCLPLLFLFMMFTVPKLDDIYLSEVENNEYTKEDLIELNMYFRDKILDMSDDFERNDGVIVFDKDLEEVAISDLLNISSKYKFLQGTYPHKFADFTDKERSLNYDITSGITQNFGVKVDFELEKVYLLYVMHHELCHVKGVMRENEADYCAFLAGINSSNKIAEYGAYMYNFLAINYALYNIDKDIANKLENDVLKLCLNENYEEICNIYAKQNKYYLLDANELEIRSYQLGNYIPYKESFINLLLKLSNEYDASILIDDKIFSNEDLKVIFQSEEFNEQYLKIKITIDENSFYDIINFLNNYDNYFMGIYQSSGNEDAPEEMSKEEAYKYYLSSFNKDDFKLLVNGEYFSEYDYSRVTRLLLEHYDYLFRDN